MFAEGASDEPLCSDAGEQTVVAGCLDLFSSSIVAAVADDGSDMSLCS